MVKSLVLILLKILLFTRGIKDLNVIFVFCNFRFCKKTSLSHIKPTLGYFDDLVGINRPSKHF